jgi:hypothetical protein
MKKRTTHLRYFPEFIDLCAFVEEGMAFFRAHPHDVKRLMGPYLEQTADCPWPPDSHSLSEQL